MNGILTTPDTTTPTVAAHVLWHYEEVGGVKPDAFLEHLIAAVTVVGPEEVLRVVNAYVSAAHSAETTDDGIDRLMAIVAAAPARPAA